ncbi:MAG: flagellar biosynthesis anti-sigma factor FlgM [Thermodesulfobacteriota bacterium]|nr:flagellar biosynthesis anti-sigma factor FlgM [Thermodesulfobacteriota bacterium]
MKKFNNKNIIYLQDYIQNTDKKNKPQEYPPIEESHKWKEKALLSIKPEEIEKVRNFLEYVTEIRMEKVSQIKQSIENQTYYIDTEKVAGKLVMECLLYEAILISK